MSFKVIDPGFMSSIQDLGRMGYQHLGITTGGPLDEYSFAWANRLLGNTANSAVLEVTYGGLKLEVQADTCIALTGADLGATLNKTYIEPWCSYAVRAGDRLDFAQPAIGLRAYLSVIDGFQTPLTLGSRATVLREQVGGLDGRGVKFVAGDRLPFLPSSESRLERTPKEDIPDYSKPLDLGVIAGYQYELFPASERRRFFSHPYQVTQNIDRMGYRLFGPAIESNQRGIISEGISLGAIQIPADGQPIVLMRDRQTIGGYPKLGNLSGLDVGLLAQRGPGAEVRFYPQDLASAQAQRQIFLRHLKRFTLSHPN